MRSSEEAEGSASEALSARVPGDLHVSLLARHRR